MTIEETRNGPVFKFPMQGERSKGIKNMQIFCFDMMLMRLCAKRGIGPGFLIHDSHLFDGVDGRQVISALRVGAEISSELGFQYIVTMNEDDAFKETSENFDLNDYVAPTRLISREFPRLCRGGSSSLTFPGVHPETLRCEPPSTHQGESGWTNMKA
jgi:hypothetical protein